MKGKILIVLIVLMALLACVGLTAARPDMAQAKNVKATPTLVSQGQAVKAAKVFLAKKLGVATGTIVLISVKAATWPDSCLGLGEEGEMCSQVLINGYRIVFRAGGVDHVLRTNIKGTTVRIE
jgi:hypothetical protein